MDLLFHFDKLLSAGLHQSVKPWLGFNAYPDCDPSTVLVQAVCELLTVAGKTLDSASPQSKQRTTAYFTVMEKWMNSKSLPSRTRFMARDLIELRRSNWIPRRAQLQVFVRSSNMPASCFGCKIHGFLLQVPTLLLHFQGFLQHTKASQVCQSSTRRLI